MHRNINTILVYSYDRFSRAGAEAIVTKAYLKSKGISVVSVTQPIDGDSIAGEFMENMLFLFNQFENNLRKEKCTAGMIECLERGEWYTKPPIGYLIDKTSKEKHQLIINEQGKLIGRAFHWRADEGLTDKQILERLSRYGLTLYKQRLTVIFHNPFYCGKIRHHLLGGRIVQGIHPRIVDEETFNKVNGIETHIGYTHTDARPETPLRLFIKCTKCGRYLTGYEVKAKHIHYYKCSEIGCKSNVSAKQLHSQFCEYLDTYNVADENTDIIASILTSTIDEYNKSSEESLQVALKHKIELETQINEVTTRFGMGAIPESVYAISKENLNRKIDELDINIKALKKSHSNHEIDIKKAIIIACNLSTYWKSADFVSRQNLQKICFPSGLKYHRETGFTRTDDSNKVLSLLRLFSDTYNSSSGIKKEEILSEILCSRLHNDISNLINDLVLLLNLSQ